MQNTTVPLIGRNLTFSSGGKELGSGCLILSWKNVHCLEFKKSVFSSLPFQKKKQACGITILRLCMVSFHFMMQLTYLHKSGVNVFIAIDDNRSDALVCEVRTP